MYQNSKEIKPLNWGAFVDETLKRRKAEKLTQREHAALANVSIPTMADFEKGETSITLAKAFDIMRVVGLFEEMNQVSHQDIFVQKAWKRWRDLTEKLPQNSPVRLPYGYCCFDYYLEGVKPVGIEQFCEIAKKSGGNTPKNASLWTWEDKNSIRISQSDNVVECWQPHQGRVVQHDFWWGVPEGRMFLIREYPEDCGEWIYATVAEGTMIDPTIHIRLMVQALHCARDLAFHMSEHGDTVVYFRALYAGLNGRTLRSIFDDSLKGAHVTRSNEMLLEVSISTEDMNSKLADYLYPLAVEFYSHFGAKIERSFFESMLSSVA